jgi:hypothetical protein
MHSRLESSVAQCSVTVGFISSCALHEAGRQAWKAVYGMSICGNVKQADISDEMPRWGCCEDPDVRTVSLRCMIDPSFAQAQTRGQRTQCKKSKRCTALLASLQIPVACSLPSCVSWPQHSGGTCSVTDCAGLKGCASSWSTTLGSAYQKAAV